MNAVYMRNVRLLITGTILVMSSNALSSDLIYLGEGSASQGQTIKIDLKPLTPHVKYLVHCLLKATGEYLYSAEAFTALPDGSDKDYSTHIYINGEEIPSSSGYFLFDPKGVSLDMKYVTFEKGSIYIVNRNTSEGEISIKWCYAKPW